MTDETQENAPAPAQAGKGRICPECGVTFHTTHHSKKFCKPEHKQDYANRARAEGALLAPWVKAWRLKRGGGAVGKRAFAEVCAIADYLNDMDRREKRPSAAVYVEQTPEDGYDFLTRQGSQADRGRAQRPPAQDLPEDS